MPARPLARARAALASSLAFLALAFALAPPAAARPGEVEEIAAKAATRPAVRFLRAIDLFPGAQTTAHAWAKDARLVYVENGDSLATDGSARAWTFVYASPERGARAFTFAESGRLTSVALPFPFDAPSLEPGWIEPSALLAAFIAGDGPAVTATRGAKVAVLSRGLLPSRFGSGTLWYVGDGRGGGGVFDALRGTTLSARGLDPTAVPGVAPATEAVPDAIPGLPAFLVAYRAGFLAVLEARANDPKTRADRPRSLTDAEARALGRLNATSAAFDTLARATTTPAALDVERALAALTAWRVEQARADSLLADSERRIAEAERDLGTERPTEMALFLAVDRRAQPAVVRVTVDDVEVARRTYGAADWTSLAAGTWSEVVRTRVRPGTRVVKVEIEGADRRVERTDWTGTAKADGLTLLKLTARGGEGGGSRLDAIAETVR